MAPDGFGIASSDRWCQKNGGTDGGSGTAADGSMNKALTALKEDIAKPVPPGHIDFALRWDEIKCCVVCGEILPDGRWWDTLTVTPTGPHPIGGLVGVCHKCGLWANDFKRKALANWRKTAPPFIAIIPDTPIQLVVRGCCNDGAVIKSSERWNGK